MEDGSWIDDSILGIPTTPKQTKWKRTEKLFLGMRHLHEKKKKPREYRG